MRIIRKGDGERYVPPGHDEKVTAVKLFNPSNGALKIDAHVTSFEPGCSMDEEVHKESDHVFYMLEGKLEVKKAGKLIGVLETGDAIHIPAGEFHQVANPGPGKGIFFAVTVPPAK